MNRIASILVILLAAFVATSCADVPTDPELDYQWQLMTINGSDGVVSEPPAPTYYCFYRHTAQIHIPGQETVTANLSYVERTSLTMEFPDNTAPQLAAMSLPVPADADPEVKGYTFTFTVNRLDSKALVMTSSGGDVYTFRKY